MSALRGAFNLACSELKPQRQGTCGLYCFWYATILLAELNPMRAKLIYPRRHENPGIAGQSMRSYAKTLGSGQGEVQSLAEMENIIRHYGYDCESHVGEKGREKFITRSLAANRPVLFPYTMSMVGPLTAPFPANLTGGVHYGAHWSLIIQEKGVQYYIIEPNEPNQLMKSLKKTILDSNRTVDDYKYARYWKKVDSETAAMVGDVKPADWGTGTTKYYDIGDTSRQQLANVLVAVF